MVKQSKSLSWFLIANRSVCPSVSSRFRLPINILSRDCVVSSSSSSDNDLVDAKGEQLLSSLKPLLDEPSLTRSLCSPHPVLGAAIPINILSPRTRGHTFISSSSSSDNDLVDAKGVDIPINILSRRGDFIATSDSSSDDDLVDLKDAVLSINAKRGDTIISQTSKSDDDGVDAKYAKILINSDNDQVKNFRKVVFKS